MKRKTRKFKKGGYAFALDDSSEPKGGYTSEDSPERRALAIGLREGSPDYVKAVESLRRLKKPARLPGDTIQAEYENQALRKLKNTAMTAGQSIMDMTPQGRLTKGMASMARRSPRDEEYGSSFEQEMGMKKGGKVKKKRYDEGGEIEFESKMGANPQIDDMTRVRAQDYVEEMQRPAPTEIETKEAPKVKKAAPKPQPKAEPKPAPKVEPKKASGEEPSFFKGTKGYKNLGALFKAMREKAGITSYKSGGSVSSASKRADGCAIRGKTKGRMV